MSKPQNKQVKLAYLHNGISIPGVMTTDSTLNDVKYKGLKMQLVDEGLELRIKSVVAVVPLANVKIMIYES